MYETCIGHVHLKVRDLDRAIAFYTRFLNLRLVERVGDQYAFLSGGAVHQHDLCMQHRWLEVPYPHPGGDQVGVGGLTR